MSATRAAHGPIVPTRPSPEYRVLRALDDLRDAFAAYLADPTPPAETPALLTITDAAKALGISRATCTRWCNAQRLPTVGPKHARRVPASAIAALRGEPRRSSSTTSVRP